MDKQSLYSVSVLAPTYDDEGTRGQIRSLLERFILEFQLDNVFIYRSEIAQYIRCFELTGRRDQIRENALVKQYFCEVDIAHLIKFNDETAHALTTEPAEMIPLVRMLRLPASPLLTSISSKLC